MINQLLEVVDPRRRWVLRRMLVALVGGAVLQGIAFALLIPVLRALLGPEPATVWPWLWVLAGITVAYAVAYHLGLRLGSEAGATLSENLHHRIGDHVATLPLGWFSAERVGQLSNLAGQSVFTIMGVPAHLLRPLVTGFLTPATVVVAMFFVDWRLALAATATVPVIALVYRWSSRLTERADETHASAQAEAAGRVIEFAQTQRVLRAFGQVSRGHVLLDEALAAQRGASRAVLVRGVPGQIGFALAIQASFTAVMVYGTYLVLGGSLVAPELLALLVLAARFVEPMAEAAALGSVLRSARGALRRVRDLLAVEPLPEPARPRTPTGSTIEFDDVSFGYDGTPVLDGVSFAVPEHTMTALVGPSGSGKTTITRLIARFWDVGSGTVRVGGVDVRDVDSEELMARISMVFQDVYLFEGTIEDNIRVGRPDATPEQVRDAARLARVDEIAARLPDGWQTRVGEGGARLSGGERQRVSIARAILKDAPIVLLDEATASLDPENEEAVQDALSALTADRTLLVIAHRLRTVTAADEILVLDGGRIVERGTHDELLAASGRYASFWAERSRAGGWRLARSS